MEVERRKFVSALITGRVIDAGFSPVEGADVYCEVMVQRRFKGVPDDQSSSLAKASTSGGDGTFSFTVEREIFESASMTIYVSARCRGYAPTKPAQVDASAGGSFSFTLALRAGGSVRGRVVDAQGIAVAGVKVALGKQATAAERSARAGDYFEAVTDADGAYGLDDVPQGVHRIGVLSLIHNYRQGPTEAAISDAPLMLEDIVVEVVISIRLRVVEAGGAKLHGPCTLSFRENGKDKQRIAGFVTGDGLVELAHPPLGTFDVFIKVEGCLESASLRLTFSLGQTTDAGTFAVNRDPDYVKQR
jgi:Carboxypeptidase regulatory-like domain